MSYYDLKSYSATPNQSYETLPLNVTTKACCAKTEPRCCFELHNHETFELLAIQRGCLRVTLEEEEYLLHPGEMLLVNPWALHKGQWNNDCDDGEYVALFLQLSELLSFNRSPLVEALNALREGTYQFDVYYPAGNLFFDDVIAIHRLYHNKSAANDALCIGKVYSFLGMLFKEHFHQKIGSLPIERDKDFIKNVCLYVGKHYQEDISTKDAAAALYMDSSQFCRMFRRHFHMNFSNHLCELRTRRAAELYRNSRESIAYIARQVGFHDYSYFSRSFKRYIGVTPAYYFGKWKKSEHKEEKLENPIQAEELP